MNWTDQIRQIKIILVVVAVIIAAASLVTSHFLVSDLKQEESKKMSVWAEAMRSLNTADETTDLTLVLRVIDDNNTIPVIVTDEHDAVQTFRNVTLSASTASDSLSQLASLAARWKSKRQVVRISIDNDSFIDVCYDESLLIKRLATYPYVQLGVVLLFVVIAIFALLTSKKAEQNKVWVGLSKETAHQLGTPISSLMAWHEMLKETYPDDELLPEMGKDIARLQLIADRFSKIGSLPEPSPASLNTVMEHVIEYMERRTSRKVSIVRDFPARDIVVRLNASLFEWVIENLCKNAVDAITGKGTIDVSLSLLPNGTAQILVSDTGRGIPSGLFKSVFRPGFTTKKRGWGLGLSLAKRIVEQYHGGRIFVKSSQVGVGTSFAINLPCPSSR